MQSYEVRFEGELDELARTIGYSLDSADAAVRHDLLSRLLDWSFDSADDAAHAAWLLLGDAWSQWLAVVPHVFPLSGPDPKYLLSLTGWAWDRLTDLYMDPHTRADFIRQTSLALWRGDADAQ